MTEKKSIDCWIISSGLIGCENQCIGLAEELNFNYSDLPKSVIDFVKRNNLYESTKLVE